MLNEKFLAETEVYQKPCDLNRVLTEALVHQSGAMEERFPGRTDVKYEVLRSFLLEIETTGKSFAEVYASLEDSAKHAIITRLQNEAMSGTVPYEEVTRLERDLYGVEADEDGEMICFSRKVELEKVLDEENRRRGLK